VPGSGNGGAPLRVFQTRAQTRAFYNRISRFYDALSDRSEASARRAGLRLLDVRAGEKALEVGFGTGSCLVELARAAGPGGEVCGVDLAERMVERARGRLRKAGLLGRCRLRRGDATRLPLAAGVMDAVFMSFTLELFDGPEIPRVLGECRRVLRDGGRIVVVGLSKESGGNRATKAFEWAHRHFPQWLDCRPIYVRRALEDAGFAVRHVKSYTRWVPVEIVLGAKEGA
jgi:demethylmenaquinone methyltransferase/2-methoxy-6-polyprenyl-1,4-benzoquinol methylase